jgi:hypothetical protein
VRCILAASTLDNGKAAAKSVMAAVAAHREEFEFDCRRGGPNLEMTPNGIIRRMEGYSGLNSPRPLRSRTSTAKDRHEQRRSSRRLGNLPVSVIRWRLQLINDHLRQ